MRLRTIADAHRGTCLSKNCASVVRRQTEASLSPELEANEARAEITRNQITKSRINWLKQHIAR